MITWTSALSNSMKQPCCVGPPKMDGSWWRVLTKCGPLEKRMANHSSILASKTPWIVWKGKKTNKQTKKNNVILEEEPLRSAGVQYATVEEQRTITNSCRKNKEAGSKQKQHWLCLVVKVKSDAVKSNIASWPGRVSSGIKVNWTWSNRRWQEWTLTF